MELNSLEGDDSRVFEEIIDKNHPIFEKYYLTLFGTSGIHFRTWLLLAEGLVRTSVFFAPAQLARDQFPSVSR